MSKTTPHVKGGVLTDTQTQQVVNIETEAWFDWLKDANHHSFHYTHLNHGFTARKERKQRGDSYWVAYRQFHNKLHKLYLGKSECLTKDHLCQSCLALANLIATYEQQQTDAMQSQET